MPSTTAQSSRTSAAASPTTATSAITQSQLKSALLAVTALPTGWSTTPPSTDKKTPCNQPSVTKAVPPAATAEADFVMGTDVPFFGDILNAYSDAATAGRAFDKYQSVTSACTSYNQDGVKVDIGQLSVPSLGDRSIGYRLTLSQGGSSVVLDNEFIQRGEVIVFVGYGDLTADTQQLATFSKLAYDKAVRTLHLS